jgi:hypothetical protein
VGDHQHGVVSLKLLNRLVHQALALEIQSTGDPVALKESTSDCNENHF